MLCHFDPVAIQDLDIILHLVSQFDGQSIRRVEDDLDVVCTILILSPDAKSRLLPIVSVSFSLALPMKEASSSSDRFCSRALRKVCQDFR